MEWLVILDGPQGPNAITRITYRRRQENQLIASDCNHRSRSWRATGSTMGQERRWPLGKEKDSDSSQAPSRGQPYGHFGCILLTFKLQEN